MARKNLALCFDAFGTLFSPKRPITQQYAEVARQCGLTGIDENELQSSFKKAFKDESKQNPNYGNSTGLGATKWWTNVIHRIFTPLIATGQQLPPELATRLLHRFSSSEAYTTEANLVANLKRLKSRDFTSRFDKVIIGVITNSDDRVPGILSSFGLNVSPLRYGTDIDHRLLANHNYDIDFHCMSYDVGVEKPDPQIFLAAESMLAQVIKAHNRSTSPETHDDLSQWQKVYVGDEYAKDVVGASNAGWKSILLDAKDENNDIPPLTDFLDLHITSLLEENPKLRINSIQSLFERIGRES